MRGSDPEWQLGVVEVATTAVLGLGTVAIMGVYLYGLWSGRPAVELNRSGVRVLAPFGYLAVPWDGLRPGYPLQPSRRTGTLALTATYAPVALLPKPPSTPESSNTEPVWHRVVQERTRLP